MPTLSRKTVLLATDQQNSVLNAVDAATNSSIAYTPYGDSPQDDAARLRFNGEFQEPVTRLYSLGQGYRMYNAILMRFICPDAPFYSPFGKGGLNPYAYCKGDPINRVDPTGNFSILKVVGNMFGRNKSTITKEIDTITSQIKPLKTSIAKNKKSLSRLEKLEDYAPGFIDRQNKRYMDHSTTTLASSSDLTSPPPYQVPPSYEITETLEMINIISEKSTTYRNTIATDMRTLEDLKSYRKILKQGKRDPIENQRLTEIIRRA